MKRMKAPPVKIQPGQFNILTNDPSMTAWGWAVVDINSDTVLSTGCIKTEPTKKKMRIRKSDDRVRRVSEITRELQSIITTYQVRYFVSELPHGSQNASAAVMIGIVIGILQTMSDILDIGIEWYSEQDSKKEILKKKAATKEEMYIAIRFIYGKQLFTGIQYKDEAIADAMAVYHLAKTQSSSLKLLRKT